MVKSWLVLVIIELGVGVALVEYIDERCVALPVDMVSGTDCPGSASDNSV